MAFRFVWRCSNCSTLADWTKPKCPNCQHAWSKEKLQWECDCQTLNDYADDHCTNCSHELEHYQL
jgi:hypothetical protein